MLVMWVEAAIFIQLKQRERHDRPAHDKWVNEDALVILQKFLGGWFVYGNLGGVPVAHK